MEARRLVVETRTGTGKGYSRKLRAAGKVPGVCYGRGSETISLVLDPEALSGALDAQLGMNTLLKLEITGESGGARLVLLKDRQIHPISMQLLHADFVEIHEGEKLRVEVPLNLLGKPEGVKLGGMLSQPRRVLLVECEPDKIPVGIDVDVSHLEMGQSIHIEEVAMPEGVAAVYDVNFTIAGVVAPTAEEEVVEEEEELAEGEVAEGEDAEGEDKEKAEGDDKKADKKD